MEGHAAVPLAATAMQSVESRQLCRLPIGTVNQALQPEENMRYKTSLITYLDVLGFRRVVRQAKEPDEPARVLELFRRFSKPETSEARQYQQFYVGFSDLGIRIRYIDAGLI